MATQTYAPQAPPSSTIPRVTPAPPAVLDGDEKPPVSLALRQRFAKTNPKYAHSFGTVAFERSSSSGLRLIGWRAVDVVQQIWEKLVGSLKSLIGETRDTWEAWRPRCRRGEQRSGSDVPLYVLRCFLLGPDQAHATPHAAILCDTPWFRKAIGSVFIKSGLLLPAGFKCFGLPDRVDLYMAPAGSVWGSSHSGPRPLIRLNDFDIRTPAQYQSTNGLSIEILLDSTIVGSATIGGVVEIGKSTFGMTVRHTFRDPNEDTDWPELDDHDSDTHDCEIDLFEEDDLKEHDPLLVVGQPKSESPASEMFQDGRSTSNLSSGDLVPAGSDLVHVSPDQWKLETGVLTAPEARLDWALISLQRLDQNQYFIEPSSGAHGDLVVIKTPSRLRYGDLGSSGVLGIPMTTAPQSVLVVSVDDIQPGDCGSWAMKLRDGAFTVNATPQNDPDYASYLNNLGSLQGKQFGRTGLIEAEKLFTQEVEMSKLKLGDDHPDTLTSMANLASIYRNQGRWEEAEKLDVQVMETRKVKLGDDHPDTLTSMANLALTYGKQGRWEEAEKLGVQVMETRKVKLGDDHPDTLTSMNNLAWTWKSQGRLADAQALMRSCVDARQRILGLEHPGTLSSLKALDQWSS
ncbi:hypothetical protein SAPIO_CDS7599 [Scedosporium apiospermum]|uniref:Kinesin light chain n=1 Tax=Pseudallescheria apiosperma TaxID=563466 RepID=A0A084G296_PSEDA|nr:uncharacterized protein SAPIO_CDS7599 [Scedosporium apiospermum]KEZ41458.1 hypothetical protein SAPIO_CDS7599 [Scedosporium apiospermum]